MNQNPDNTQSDNIALRVKNLSKTFWGKGATAPVHAVRNISFEVKKGEILGFLGPNGAGKTTTMRMITGVLSIPESASVEILGKDLRAEPKEAKKNIGIVPEISNAFGEYTVIQNILFSARIYGLSPEEARNRAEALLKEFDLMEKKEKIIRSLSKGLKQRVNFCMALIHDPDLLIFDEPTSGLDPISVRILRKKIGELKARGKTIILSTHDLKEAEMLCDRVFIINKGRIIADESPENLRKKFSRNTKIRFTIAGVKNKNKDGIKSVEKALAEKAGYMKERGGFVKLCEDPLKGVEELQKISSEMNFTIGDLRVEPSSLEEIFIRLIENDNENREEGKEVDRAHGLNDEKKGGNGGNGGKTGAILSGGISFKNIWILSKKNVAIYFKKGPVIVFGFLFPFFLMLSWVIGRNLPSESIFIGITAMGSFFTATALSPVVLPIETKERSLERQIASPLGIPEILFGIITASTIFSSLITYCVALLVGLIFKISMISIGNLALFVVAIPIMCLIGSLIGVSASALPSEQTSDVMVIINLIKFPLVFISGIFIPLTTLNGGALYSSYISPLTPFVDILYGIMGRTTVLASGLNILLLIAWIVLISIIAVLLHMKTMERRFTAGARKQGGPTKGK